MRARLFCKTGELAGAEYEITDQARIGKSAKNDIRLTPSTISGEHARIFVDDDSGSFVLEDLNSSNGTRLDGMVVRNKETLGKLHVITFANGFDFIFQVVEQAPVADSAAQPPTAAETQPAAPPQTEAVTAVTEAADTTRLEADGVAMPSLDGSGEVADERTQMDGGEVVMPNLRNGAEDTVDKTVMDQAGVAMPDLSQEGQDTAEKTMMDQGGIVAPNLGGQAEATAESPVPDAPSYQLTCRAGDGSETTWDLKQGENVVGRATKCEISISDKSLSRRHAVLIVSGDKIRVKDLGSVNHTFVDSETVTEETTVIPDTRLKFGLVTARITCKTND